mmetsp:Transcript_19508/g.57364  ORF Transcript_19508/g.57364 Transcript_19508/m.57364 type:complete len:249 (-) Transcript_19508:679-1425(-)
MTRRVFGQVTETRAVQSRNALSGRCIVPSGSSTCPSVTVTCPPSGSSTSPENSSGGASGPGSAGGAARQCRVANDCCSAFHLFNSSTLSGRATSPASASAVTSPASVGSPRGELDHSVGSTFPSLHVAMIAASACFFEMSAQGFRRCARITRSYRLLLCGSESTCLQNALKFCWPLLKGESSVKSHRLPFLQLAKMRWKSDWPCACSIGFMPSQSLTSHGKPCTFSFALIESFFFSSSDSPCSTSAIT